MRPRRAVHLPPPSEIHTLLQNGANTCICHTSEESPVSLIIATLPKTPSRKSFACHTCDPFPPSSNTTSEHRVGGTFALARFSSNLVLRNARSRIACAIVKGGAPVYGTNQVQRTARQYAWHAEPGSPAGVPYAGEHAAQRGKPIQERPLS